MAQTATNVTAAKPKTGGAVYVAPTSATLPTSTASTLTGFTSLGYISDDGMTNETATDQSDIKAWGGDVVLSSQAGKTDTFQFTLIEALNTDVLKEIYGANNVSGTLASGITVNVDSTEATERAWVADTVMRNGVAKRIVIPSGKITEVGEITYKDDEAVGYEITITAFPDTNGKTHIEYIKAAAGGTT